MQLHKERKHFEEAGFQIVLVGLGTAEQAEKFRTEFSLSFPMICDPQKELYSLFGLGRGTLRTMASATVLMRGLRAMYQGNTPGIPSGDVMQMPGVFLIDTDGTIRYSYYAKDASDHPPVDSLLALKDLFN